MNSEYIKIIDKMKDLKETLRQYRDFWAFHFDEQIRILERILTNLELRCISGEVDVREWERMRIALTLGLDSMKAGMAPDTESPSRPDPPVSFFDEAGKAQLNDTTENSLIIEPIEIIPKVANFSDEMRDKNPENMKKNDVKLRSQEKTKRRFVKNKRESEDNFTLGTHCRNPWNTGCRNTDIELSIYYKSEFLPICHSCWQKISEKNLEW